MGTGEKERKSSSNHFPTKGRRFEKGGEGGRNAVCDAILSFLVYHRRGGFTEVGRIIFRREVRE